MFSEGNAALSFVCDSSLQIVMAIWHASNLKKLRQRPLLFTEGCHTLTDHSAELFAEGRRALKAIKSLLGPISSPILDLGFFLKSQCHHKIQEDSCKDIQL
jgi:hypothetical protein